MLFKDGANNEFVDCKCALCLWSHQEYEESDSNVEVEGDEVEDETTELVNEVEESEDGPVGEPLLVVVLASWLDGLDALDWGINYCEDYCQDSATEQYQDQYWCNC